MLLARDRRNRGYCCLGFLCSPPRYLILPFFFDCCPYDFVQSVSQTLHNATVSVLTSLLVFHLCVHALNLTHTRLQRGSDSLCEKHRAIQPRLRFIDQEICGHRKGNRRLFVRLSLTSPPHAGDDHDSECSPARFD